MRVALRKSREEALMNYSRLCRFGLIYGVSLAACEMETVHAQSALSDRVWKVSNSVVSAVQDPKLKISTWRFKRPISFNVIDASSVTTTEELVRTAILPTTVDADCVGKTLERLSANSKDSVASPDDGTVALVESNYLKEKSLTKADLDRYKNFQKRYVAEKQRLALLSPQQAEAEAKLPQIETEWETIGRRSDFAELENRISKLPRPSPDVDVSTLRTEIFDANNKIIIRLSVPISQWVQYDSWVHVRKSGVDPGIVPKFKEVELPAGVKFNDNSCGVDAAGCASDLMRTFSKGTTVSVSILAPQFDIPWIAKFTRAASVLHDPSPNCIASSRLDRLILAHGVGTSFDYAQLGALVQLLSSSKRFGEDNIQFAGLPDLGAAYAAVPSFADGILVSPHSYILGFTTFEFEMRGK
jgi:hypothetical protein